jgi:hypothetical protein
MIAVEVLMSTTTRFHNPYRAREVPEHARHRKVRVAMSGTQRRGELVREVKVARVLVDTMARLAVATGQDARNTLRNTRLFRNA